MIHAIYISFSCFIFKLCNSSQKDKQTIKVYDDEQKGKTESENKIKTKF